MLTKMQKWGNSQGLRFPKAILEEASMEVGDEVKVSVRGRKIIIEPVKKVRGRYDLKELVSRMPKNYQVEEVDWGVPVGKEEW
ncbi:MAG: AbrB/MazE/SpoVT family DNA-binding domain-containing protein [Nitrospirales bacterium]|nr:AbrB/MazE/SpoVT family DNA-binding domain-containing protein [Nitrospirales bacterium]